MRHHGLIKGTGLRKIISARVKSHQAVNISGKLTGQQVNRRRQAGLLYSRVQSLTNAEAKKRHCLRKCGTWWYDKYNGIYHPHPQPNGHEPYLKRERVIQSIKYAEHHPSTQDGPWWFYFLYLKAPSKWEKCRRKQATASLRKSQSQQN